LFFVGRVPRPTKFTAGRARVAESLTNAACSLFSYLFFPAIAIKIIVGPFSAEARWAGRRSRRRGAGQLGRVASSVFIIIARNNKLTRNQVKRTVLRSRSSPTLRSALYCPARSFRRTTKAAPLDRWLKSRIFLVEAIFVCRLASSCSRWRSRGPSAIPPLASVPRPERIPSVKKMSPRCAERGRGNETGPPGTARWNRNPRGAPYALPPDQLCFR